MRHSMNTFNCPTVRLASFRKFVPVSNNSSYSDLIYRYSHLFVLQLLFVLFEYAIIRRPFQQSPRCIVRVDDSTSTGSDRTDKYHRGDQSALSILVAVFFLLFVPLFGPTNEPLENQVRQAANRPLQAPPLENAANTT